MEPILGWTSIPAFFWLHQGTSLNWCHTLHDFLVSAQELQQISAKGHCGSVEVDSSMPNIRRSSLVGTRVYAVKDWYVYLELISMSISTFLDTGKLLARSLFELWSWGVPLAPTGYGQCLSLSGAPAPGWWWYILPAGGGPATRLCFRPNLNANGPVDWLGLIIFDHWVLLIIIIIDYNWSLLLLLLLLLIFIFYWLLIIVDHYG